MQILGQCVRKGLFHVFLALFLASSPITAFAAPYAAMVIDARSGEVLHARNADAQLHPASLTKMMTLYVAFEAIEHGEISLDTMVRISKKAASEQPSKLGLRAGQKIKLRYLLRAAAVKSANDAATAIGEAIEGSEAAFARRMNRTAKAMGMSRTNFKNAHGLTEVGHMSTARDMTKLGRHVFYDYPEYYNLFSRITANAGVKEVYHTNRSFLRSYKGADGIKTGYTRAAGFNLVASAERGNERIIATVFGGRSTATRNAKVAELLDLGFQRAPSRIATRKPKRPAYAGRVGGGTAVASNDRVPAGKTIRLVTTLKKSRVPKARPVQATPEVPEELMLALKDDIKQAVAEAATQEVAVAPQKKPEVVTKASAPVITVQPKARPSDLQLASIEPEQQEVVTRVSTSSGRHWGINVGRYGSRYEAERVLLKTALKELGTLDNALRKVSKNSRGFDANFVGMSKEQAALACRRLESRGAECSTFGPS